MTPAELESRVSCWLDRLPEPEAPSSLVPRVMAGLERMANRPWYQRPWRSWPMALRAAGAAVFAALLWLSVQGLEWIDGTGMSALLGTAHAIWRLVIEPSAVYLVASAGVMGAACALYCAAISRVLLERSPE